MHWGDDKRHTERYRLLQKTMRWNAEKNETLRSERGVSFEAMVVAISAGGTLDVVPHPNPSRYPDQRILVVAADGYVYLIPFVEEDRQLFLKTIIPSRKATRDYLRRGGHHGEA